MSFKTMKRRGLIKSLIRTCVFIFTVLPETSVSGQGCGAFSVDSEWRAKNARVIGGFQVEPGQFPSYVGVKSYIRAGGESYYITCGGTLIDSRRVLTAAHCLDSLAITDYINVESADGRVLTNVHRTCISANYNRKVIRHDVAVLELSDPVEFGEELQPACLPNRALKDNELAYLVGKGLTETGNPSSRLLAIAMVKDSCWRFGPEHFSVQCVTSAKNSGRACKGDSGGPILTTMAGRQTVVGVDSFGPLGCKRDALPIGMADVYNLRDEIDGLIYAC